eukprot:1707139-Amphidinium_carterae.1
MRCESAVTTCFVWATEIDADISSVSAKEAIARRVAWCFLLGSVTSWATTGEGVTPATARARSTSVRPASSYVGLRSFVTDTSAMRSSVSPGDPTVERVAALAAMIAPIGIVVCCTYSLGSACTWPLSIAAR